MHRFAMLLAVLVLVAHAAPAHAAGDIWFSAGVRGEGGFAQLPRWRALLHKLHKAGEDRPLPVQAVPGHMLHAPQDGRDLPDDCDTACAQAHWTAFLLSIRHKPRLVQLRAVNRWANARPYVEDWVNWGVSDYWETPVEFLRRGGDCDDFAIAKYLSLIRLGFPPSDLRIVVVDDQNLKASHAVVAVRLDGRTWLLDIVVPHIIPAEIARQYRPVYAFNNIGWWLYPPARQAVVK